MKISEAMRLGAMMHPQGFGRLFDHRFNDRTRQNEVISSCALGAVLDGGLLSTDLRCIEVYEKRLCPACQEPQANIEYIIVHLNDHHRWTREAIADWLETVESAMQTPVTATPVAEEELVLV